MFLQITRGLSHFISNSHADIVTYTYDETSSANGIGRLTSVTDSSGTTKFFYDKMGRITQTNKIVDGTTYTTKTGYDSAGRMISVGYPDTSTISYTYNGTNLLKVYEGTSNYAQYSGYNALGQPSIVTFGKWSSYHLYIFQFCKYKLSKT